MIQLSGGVFQNRFLLRTSNFLDIAPPLLCGARAQAAVANPDGESEPFTVLAKEHIDEDGETAKYAGAGGKATRMHFEAEIVASLPVRAQPQRLRRFQLVCWHALV